ncbi:DNA primase [Listeria booriae]|uniref:DNA primase n=1 Tax=Listeria booriae TaxID=1552123 RepID=UPI0016242A20|nr:DNA primase [Listeria booriae]MBC1511753.1 DNA primase [Listeria booriae]MBC6150344.1 DNA primase [Listeria booriae]MBC6304799.1 DNA primase [Listeria booriae]
MQRIPEEKIDEIRSQVDIVDVVGNYVQLKKQGRNYTGLCPFHGEKTPSFSVSPEKQIFHCFGCGKGGNVFSFLMQIDGLSFVESVKKVADLAHIPLDVAISQGDSSPGNKPDSQESKMIEIHQLASKLYHYLLMETEEGQEALQYLLDRGMSEQELDHFEIGFAPAHASTVTTFLKKREVDLALAVESGLLTERDDGEVVDRFRNRIMFPIKNDRGQLVGFSGRLFNQEDGPKYLNSPETPIFNKRNILYHFSDARQEIRKKEEILLLEGYMDVISSVSATFSNGVASMGTSLTEEHVQMIRRVTNRAIICYDGDRAGIEASFKAGTMLAEQHRLEVFVLQLPNGKDPDDFIRSEGAEKFAEIYTHQRLTWTAFKLQFFKRNRNLQNETDKIAYLGEALAEIGKLDQAIERELYLKQLGSEFDLSMEALKQQLQQTVVVKPKPHDYGGPPPESYGEYPSYEGDGGPVYEQFSFAQPSSVPSAGLTSEKRLLKYMLEDRDAFIQIRNLLEEHQTGFYHDNYKALYTHLIGFYASGNDANPLALMDQLKDDMARNLVSELEMMTVNTDVSIEEYQDYVQSLTKSSIERDIKEKEQALLTATQQGDIPAALELARTITTMRATMKNTPN